MMRYAKSGSRFRGKISRLRSRRGATTLDYVLLLALTLPLLAFVMWAVPLIVGLLYDFTETIINSPIM